MFRKIIFALSALAAFTLLNNTAHSMPVIGEIAPNFKAETTQGEMNFPKDYEGKWVVLFSHPGDFTPVCTSEFMAFQTAMPKFEALNTKLVGISEDNAEEHKKWIDSIKTIEFACQKDVNITFPIIDDAKGNIAKKYGMLQRDKNDTKTVRAVFVIDPESKIRAIIYYPQSTGRFIPEIQRLVIALQTSDACEVATPANWMPGDDVIVPTAKIPEGYTEEQLKAEGITKHSPYLYTKKLNKECLCDKIIK